MHKFNKRNLLLVVGIASLIIGLAVGLYYLLNKEKPEVFNQNIVSSNPELEVELNPPEQVQNYLMILEKFNSKDYAETIVLAQSYGRSEASQSTERLSAYRVCIDAARLSEKKETMEACNNEVQVLINGIEDLDVRNIWSEQIKSAMSGTAPIIQSDGQEDGQR